MSATTSLPGGRLLGRLQNRKSSLNQRLQDLNVRSDEHQNETEAHSQSSEHFAGQNLKRQNSRRRRNRSDELSRDLDSDDMQSTAVIEFPFGPKNDSASTHNVIRKTLSILQKGHSPGSLLTTPESSRSSRSPSVRSLMLSRPSEIHSPTRELPPLIESDETNPNADLDTISTVTSLGASSYRSGKRGLFQRVHRADSSADVHDFDVLLTSLSHLQILEQALLDHIQVYAQLALPMALLWLRIWVLRGAYLGDTPVAPGQVYPPGHLDHQVFQGS